MYSEAAEIVRAACLQFEIKNNEKDNTVVKGVDNMLTAALIISSTDDTYPYDMFFVLIIQWKNL